MAKDILKNSIWYTVLGFLPLSISFVFAPLYLQYLDEEQYAILNLFVLYTGIFTQIYGLGIGNAFGYLYWDVYKDETKLKQLISSTLGLLLFFQIIFISISLIFGELIVDLVVKSSKFSFNPIFILVILLSAFMVYNELFLYYFRNQDKVKQYALISVSTLILLTTGTLIGVVALDLKAEGAIYGRSIGYFIVIGLVWLFFVKKYGIRIDLKSSKHLLAFGLPLFINALIGALGYNIDKLMIERLDSLKTLGVYAFASIVITFMEVIFNALNNAIAPTLYKYINESHLEKGKEIKALSHTIFLIILLAISLVIAGIIPVMNIIIPENFHAALQYIPILASAFVWRVFTTLSSYSLYTQKKTNYLLFNQSSNIIVTLILGYIGYYLFGTIGIAYAIYFVRVIEFIIIHLISLRVKVIDFGLRKLILISVIVGIACFICSYFYDNSSAPIVFILPLTVSLISLPLLAKEEIRNVKYMIKNRKTML